MRSPPHLPFALRTAKFLDEFLTRPGLIVLLVTGLWMAASRWSLALLWVRWAVILVLYLIVGPLLQRLIRVAEVEGLASSRWARLDRAFGVAGGASGLIIVMVVWLMVT